MTNSMTASVGRRLGRRDEGAALSNTERLYDLFLVLTAVSVIINKNTKHLKFTLEPRRYPKIATLTPGGDSGMAEELESHTLQRLRLHVVKMAQSW